MHRDSWGCLSSKIRESFLFLNKEEIPRAPPAAEIINNLSKTTTRRPFSPRRAPPCSPPSPPPPALQRHRLLQHERIRRESLCFAGSLRKSFTLIQFDPRWPGSRRSGSERMTAGGRLGWGRGYPARSRDAPGEQHELTTEMRGTHTGRRKPGLKADN